MDDVRNEIPFPHPSRLGVEGEGKNPTLAAAAARTGVERRELSELDLKILARDEAVVWWNYFQKAKVLTKEAKIHYTMLAQKKRHEKLHAEEV